MKHPKLLTLTMLLTLAMGCSKKTADEHYVDAQKFLDEQNLAAAVIELKSAIQINPENAQYRLLLAQTATKVGDLATAEKEYQKAIANGIEVNTVAQAYLRSMFMTGKHRELIKFIEEQKNINEENTAIAQVFKLLIELDNDNDDLAKTLLDSLSAQDTFGDISQFAKALMLNNANQPDAALLQLNDIAPSSRIQPEILFIKARLQLGQRKLAEAEQSFSEFLQVIPNYFPAQLLQAQLFVEARKMNEAKTLVGKLLQLSPEQPLVNYLSAVLAFEDKDFIQAKERSEKAMTNGFDTDAARILAGLSAVNLNLNAQALVHFDRSSDQIAKVPELARLYQSLLLSSGRSAEVKAELLSKNPAENDPQLIAATAYQLLREGADADAIKLLSTFPKNEKNAANLPIAALKLGIDGLQAEGLAELEQALTQNPKSEQAREVLAQSYLRSGQYAKAEQLADYWIQSSTEPVIGHNLKAYSAMLQANAEQARIHLNNAGDAAKTNPFSLLLRAAIAQSEKNLADATKFYQASLDADPNYLPAIMPYYQVMKEQGKIQPLIADLSQRLEKHTDASSLRIGLALVYGKEQQFQQVIDLIQADKGINQPVEYRKLLIEANNGLKNMPEVLKLTKSWSEENPENIEVAITYSRALLLNNESVQAFAVLDRLLVKRPANQQLLKAKFALHMQNNDVVGALSTFEQITTAPNQQVQAMQLKTQLLIKAKQLPQAKSYLENEYRKSQTDETASLLAEVYMRSDAKPLALALLKNHFARFPRHENSASLYANLLLETDQTTALAIYKQVLHDQSTNFVSLNNYAWLLHQAGDSQTALKFINRALTLTSNQPDALDTLGAIQLKLGNNQQAIEALKSSLQVRPNHPEVMLNLAEAFISVGDKKSAYELLNLITNNSAEQQTRLEQLKAASR